MTPARGHYSIGEVLSLLQSDFPDVTISKIRFLESQGLIDPERTPSGYRRFFEEDLERLRWILVQQRDHYLPLKVIRERLDAGEPFPDEPSVDSDGGGDDAADAVIPADVELAPADPPTAAPTVQPPTKEPDRASAESRPPVQPDAAREPAAAAVPHEGAGPSDRATTQDQASSPAEGEPVPKRRAEPETREQRVATPPEAEPVASEAAPPPIAGRPSVARPREARATTSASTSGDEEVGVRARPAEPAPPVEVALTRDELARASGCSAGVLSDLERFGLLRGTSSGSTVLYDRGALTVATLAARFASHGLEPRHLRSFRQAAEREIGLFAQVVGPLLQRRDPSAHARAVDAVTELVDLAAELHRVLIDDLAAEELRAR